ncbi:MAG: hypothetical protein ACD_60C00100G0029, partial [uncultured bacterium]
MNLRRVAFVLSAYRALCGVVADFLS